MPASVFRYCASCRDQHELIISATNFYDADATYEYHCPSTALPVRLQIREWARITSMKRPEAVEVALVDED